jgi:hypothetical protein
MRYVYLGAAAGHQGVAPLAVEPDIFGPRRLVLLSNGDIRPMDSGEIARALATGSP